MKKGLGLVQRQMLAALLRNGGEWFEYCGWRIDTTASMRRVMETLLERELVEKFKHADGHRDIYRVSNKGYDLALARIGTVEMPNRREGND